MTFMWRAHLALMVTAVIAVACGSEEQASPITLGPADGHDLPAVDTGRVAVGDIAPDFTLASYDGEPITLSRYRGVKDVVLVFYRGHW